MAIDGVFPAPDDNVVPVCNHVEQVCAREEILNAIQANKAKHTMPYFPVLKVVRWFPRGCRQFLPPALTTFSSNVIKVMVFFFMLSDLELNKLVWTIKNVIIFFC